MNAKNKSVPILILVAMVLSPLFSQAQNRYGIRAGLNVSNISFEELPDRSERFGYHIGVFADFPVVHDFMSIQPELSYSVKGAAFKTLNERRRLNFNYVDVFLPVGFKLGSIDVQVGPFASFLTSSPDYAVYNDNRVIVDAFKQYDVGLTVGLSYYFSNLMIGIRYDQGFVDVTKDSSRVLLGSGKNTVGQVSLGYRF